MLSCCLKYKKDIDIVNPKASESSGKTILLSKCAMFNSQTSRFSKDIRSKWVIK